MSIAFRRGTTGAASPIAPYSLGTPYRGEFRPPYNAAAPLSIPVAATGSPTPGAMHPDVIDFGAAWHGYRYWMGFTPYNGTADTEIPSVVATNDITNGGTWEVPTGYTNPVTPDPAGAGHMADTDLVYDASTGLLHLLYVSTNESTYQDIRSKSTDGGGTWSAESVVMAGPINAYTNPSVIKTAAGWRMYYTNDTGPLDGLYYRDSSTAPHAGYGTEQTATLSLHFGAYQRKMQNLNVVKDVGGAIVAVISDSNTGSLGGMLMFARSADGGTTFTRTGPPVITAGAPTAWDGGGIYRASVLVDTSSTVVPAGSDVHLWYSGYKPDNTTWGTGYNKIPVACLRF